MQNEDFRKITRSPSDVIAFLQLPSTVEAVYRYLEYTNGGSLPSTGIVAGQAVSTAIDYLLGLRDKKALDIKDIDWFRTATDSEFQQSSSYFSQFVDQFQVNFQYFRLYGRPIQGNYGTRAAQQEAFIATCVPLIRRILNQYPEYAPQEELFETKAFLVSKAIIRSKWKALFQIPDPLLQQALQNALAAYAVGYPAMSSLQWMSPAHPVIKSYDAKLAVDLAWTDTQAAIEYNSRIARMGYHLVKSGIFTRYGLISVLDNQEAIQPVLTTPLSLTSNMYNIQQRRILSADGEPDIEQPLHELRYLSSLTEASVGYGLGIIAGFDINSVQVGLHLNTMRLLFTHDYVSFLCNRELHIVNTLTPAHSVVRALDKVKRGAAYGNPQRWMQLLTLKIAQRMFACNMQHSAKDQVARLQDRYEQIRKKPQLLRQSRYTEWYPVLLSDSFAERAMAHPCIGEHFTVEPLAPKRGNVLVPKHAADWQLQTCMRYDPSGFQTKSDTRYVPALQGPTVLQTLLVQRPSMTSRWQTRLDRAVEMHREYNGSRTRRNPAYAFLEDVFTGLACKQFTLDQAYLLDTNEFQPIILSMLAHVECHDKFPTTKAQMDQVWHKYQIAKQVLKPPLAWIHQMEREYEKKFTLEQNDIDDISGSIAGHVLQRIQSAPKRLRDTSLLGQFASYFILAKESTFNRKDRGHSSLKRHIIETVMPQSELPLWKMIETLRTVRPEWGAALQSLLRIVDRPSFLFNIDVQRRLHDLHALVSKNNMPPKLPDWCGIRSDSDFLTFFEGCIKKSLVLASNRLKKQYATELTQLAAQHPSLVQPEISAFLAPLAQWNSLNLRSRMKTESLLDCLVALDRQHYESLLRIHCVKTVLTITEDKIAPVVPLNIQDIWQKLCEDYKDNTLQCTELLSEMSLIIEGNRQSHCVGGYYPLVSNDECRILSLSFKEGDSWIRATAQWVKSSHGIYCAQIKGPANKTPHPKLNAIHKDLLRYANQRTDVWPPTPS